MRFIILSLLCFFFAFILGFVCARRFANNLSAVPRPWDDIPDYWFAFTRGGLITHSPPLFTPSSRMIWAALRRFFSDKDIAYLSSSCEYLGCSQELRIFLTAHSNQKEYFVRIWRTSQDNYVLWMQIAFEHDEATSQQPMMLHKTIDQFLQHVPVFLWHYTKKFSIDYCTTEWANRMGTQREEILSGTFSPFPATQEMVVLQKVQKGGLAQKVRFSRSVNGVPSFFDVYLCQDGKDGIWAYAQDVSQVARESDTIKQHSSSLQVILNQLPLALAVCDQDKKIQKYNERFAQLFQLDPKWLDKHPFVEEFLNILRNKRLLPEVVDFASYKKGFEKMLTSHKSFQEELLHLPDGRTFRLQVLDYLWGGKILLIQDISEELGQKRSLNDLSEIKTAITQHVQEGVLLCQMGGKIVLLNPYFMTLFHLKSSVNFKDQDLTTLMAQKKHCFSHEGDWQTYSSAMTSCFTKRVPCHQVVQLRDVTLVFQYTPLPDHHLVLYRQSHEIQASDSLDDSSPLSVSV